jgi:hypothetical protein
MKTSAPGLPRHDGTGMPGPEREELQHCQRGEVHGDVPGVDLRKSENFVRKFLDDFYEKIINVTDKNLMTNCLH